MEVKVIRKDNNELILKIKGEDDTLGNLISKEAMRHPGVLYSTYRIPHPLQEELEISIKFKEGVEPGEVITEIFDRIRQYLEEFRKEVARKIEA